jgi:hypothetical protein
LTSIDVSTTVLDVAARRLDERRHRVSLIAADVLSWYPQRRYDAWHDRAVFHFLVELTTNSGMSPRRRERGTGRCGDHGDLRRRRSDPLLGAATAQYTAEELGVAFARAFRLIHSEREEHTTPTGVTQPFTWAVLRRR